MERRETKKNTEGDRKSCSAAEGKGPLKVSVQKKPNEGSEGELKKETQWHKLHREKKGVGKKKGSWGSMGNSGRKGRRGKGGNSRGKSKEKETKMSREVKNDMKRDS